MARLLHALCSAEQSRNPSGSIDARGVLMQNDSRFHPPAYLIGSLVKDPIVFVVDGCGSPTSEKIEDRLEILTIATQYVDVS